MTLPLACSTPSGRDSASASTDDGTTGSTATATPTSSATGTAATTGDDEPTTSATSAASATSATSAASATSDTSDTSTTSVVTGDSEITATTTSGTTQDCIPSGADETVCDLIDDDCNGIVDDVDVGDDGFCDCVRIGLFGKPGSQSEETFKTWLNDRGPAVTVFADEPTLSPALFAQVDVMVIRYLTRTYTAEEALALSTWIEAGGGVMVLSGYNGNPAVELPPYNALLANMGLELHSPLLNNAVTEWTDHPVAAGLTSVNFLVGWPVRSLPNMPDAGVPIASLDGYTVTAAHVHGAGRMVVWGDEWISFDSEWVMTPDVPKLWVNIFNYIGPANICTVPG